MGQFNNVLPAVGYSIGPSCLGVTPVSAAEPVWDSVQRYPLGTLVSGNDTVTVSTGGTSSAAFGYGEFIYCRYATASAVAAWSLVSWTPSFTIAKAATTGALGTPLGVLAWAGMTASASNSVPLYGWVQTVGTAPVVATATVAALGAVGIGTSAGTASGTIVATKGIVGMQGAQATAATLVKQGVQTSVGFTLIFPNTDGLYVGAILTGTGLGASALVGYINPDQRTVIATVASTAVGSVAVTQTNTGYIVVTMNRPATMSG